MTKRTTFFHHTNDWSRERVLSPFWRNAAIFIIGWALGWLVFGWLLFPVKYTQVYPNELRPEAVNDYLLMTAESYAATGDLRTAGKRLRYWDDPNKLGPMMNQLAQAVETANPASAAYLHILARDLHLPATPETSAPSPSSASRSLSFSFLWLIILLVALAVLAGLILLAQRFGLLGDRFQPEALEDNFAPEDASFTGVTPESDSASATPLDPIDDMIEDDFDSEDVIEALPENQETDAALPFEEDDLDFPSDETPLSIPEPDIEDDDAPPEPPEIIPAPPPAPAAPENAAATDDDSPASRQVLRFDGDPAYNKIVSIEANDDYLGEYGLSASQTAPNNPNLAITLEVWLFDKSDTQTTDAVLAPSVIATDPDLQDRYARDAHAIYPLTEGQRFSLETVELYLEGRVRRIKLGAATHDGVPVIDYAEIELSGRRK